MPCYTSLSRKTNGRTVTFCNTSVILKTGPMVWTGGFAA